MESRRVAGGGSVQKTLLYLGEINDSDRAAWTRAIETVDERDHARQIHLFPEDRTSVTSKAACAKSGIGFM